MHKFKYRYTKCEYAIFKYLGGGVNLILPHSGSQKRQNWDEVK